MSCLLSNGNLSAFINEFISMIKSGMAVGYHFFNGYDTYPVVHDEVRQTYSGPLALATDHMVFNVSKENIKIRMSVVGEDIWPLSSTIQPMPPDFSKAVSFADFIMIGRDNFVDLIKKYYGDANKEYGSKVPYPRSVE